MKDIFKTGFEILSTLTFPQYCPLCNIEKMNTVGFICEDCWQNHPQSKKRNISLESNIEVSTRIILRYDESARFLVHQMKFAGRREIAYYLGYEIARRIKSRSFFTGGYSIVPVPLHPVRVRERGFNQSELIAEGLSRNMNLPLCFNLIRRIKNTPPQSRLSDSERRLNVSRAFAKVDSPNIKIPEKVVLIDDVFHTGSTISGCIAVLEKLGVKTIQVISAFG